MFKATLYALAICFFADALLFESRYRHETFSQMKHFGSAIADMKWRGVLV